MSVLFLLNALGIGGSERKAVAIANYLNDQEWRVGISYLEPRTPLLSSIAADISTYYLARKSKFSFAAIWRLRKAILDETFECVACINLQPLLYASLARLFVPKQQRPKIILCENTTVHDGRFAALHMIMYGPLIRRADRIIFGSIAQRSMWIDRFGIDPDRCVVIYNGVDEKKYAPRVQGMPKTSTSNGLPTRSARSLTVCAVGTLWANKNHIELVCAHRKVVDRFPEAQLVIVGDGPERDTISQKAAELGLEQNVSLLGELSDVRPVVQNSDIFVLPSIVETFSNAALEAMAMEKPVILSCTGGLPEMIEDGVSGFLYETGNTTVLAELIIRLACNSMERHRIGAKAREQVMGKFTFTRMASDYRRHLDIPEN